MLRFALFFTVSTLFAASPYQQGLNSFELGDYKKAAAFFQKAVASEPANSDHHLWLGRAHGRRAEQELRAAAAVAPDRGVDLAKFLARRKNS